MQPTWLVNLLLSFSTIHAALPPPETANHIAEYTYFSRKNAKKLSSWVKTARMTPDHRAQALSYLKKQNISETLPRMRYRASGTTIEFLEPLSSIRIDFKKMPSERTLVINGQSVDLSSSHTFTEAANKIEKAFVRPVAWFSGLGVEAVADGGDLQSVKPSDPKHKTWLGRLKAIGALSNYFGSDQLDTCMNGSESQDNHLCLWYNDATMIKADLDPSWPPNHFECDEQNRFRKMSFPLAIHKDSFIKVKYDSAGQMSEVQSTSGESNCTYKLKEGRLSEIIYDTDPTCYHGTAQHERGREEHETLEIGDKIQATSNVDVPIQRLQSCCANKKCRDEMAKLVNSTADAGESDADDDTSTEK